MIKLTKEQCEKIDVARKECLEKIDIFEKGIEFPYYYCMIKPKCSRTDWIDLLRERINENPFKVTAISTLCFKDKSELKRCTWEYLAEMERIITNEFETSVTGMDQILYDYGDAIINILKL